MGRHKGEPTELVRLKKRDARRIAAIAKKLRIPASVAYERYGRRNIDRAYRRIVLGKQYELGGEAGGA